MDLSMIVKIQTALGMELYEGQKQYLLNGGAYWFGDRRSGKTLAFCIKLALSEGEPLNMKEPENFCDSDYGFINNKRRYASSYFKRMFLDIREKLKNSGFTVREIVT